MLSSDRTIYHNAIEKLPECLRRKSSFRNRLGRNFQKDGRNGEKKMARRLPEWKPYKSSVPTMERWKRE
jgi:hypothetical protein